MDRPSPRRYTDVKTSPRNHARSTRASFGAAQSDRNGAPTANQQHSTRSKRSTNFSAFPPRICDQDALRKISKLYQRDPKRYHTLYHSVFLKEPTYDRFEAELGRIYSISSRWDIQNNPIVSNRIANIRKRMADVAVKHQKKQARRTQILREMAEKKIARWESRHNRVYSPSNSVASSTSDVSCQTVDSQPNETGRAYVPPQMRNPSVVTTAINDTRAPQPPISPVKTLQPPTTEKRRAPQPPTKTHSSIPVQTQMEDPLVEQLRERVRHLEQANERLERMIDAQKEDPLVEQLKERVRNLENVNERLERLVDIRVEQAEKQLTQPTKSKEKKGTLAKIFSVKKK